MELRWTEGNKYIYLITHPIKGFFERLIYKYRLKKRLNKLAPTYHDLRQIAECLYFLDMIYLFENDADINGISGAIKQRSGYVITIKANKTQRIVITLQVLHTITIEIFNNGKLRSKISFEDGCAEVNDKFDELLFIHINDYLMNAFAKVLLKYI